MSYSIEAIPSYESRVAGFRITGFQVTRFQVTGSQLAGSRLPSSELLIPKLPGARNPEGNETTACMRFWVRCGCPTYDVAIANVLPCKFQYLVFQVAGCDVLGSKFSQVCPKFQVPYCSPQVPNPKFPGSQPQVSACTDTATIFLEQARGGVLQFQM